MINTMKLASVGEHGISIACENIFIFNCANFGSNIQTCAAKHKHDSLKLKVGLRLESG